jgi:outer membrane protein assembly factor BamD (BamD/ComL family)
MLLAVCVPAFAAAERGVMVRVAEIYLSPDPNSQKMAQIDRGREVAVLERSHEWVKVYANIAPEQDITGWMLGKGIVTATTPNGDKILFGEAVDSENEASRRHGRKGAAEDAERLYARMAEYFPNSPLAPEAFYRAADVHWQLQREDIMSRPSAKQVDPSLRQEIDPELMHKVMKKYPHTKWADLAAYRLIDNKLCGQWDGTPKCPEKEAELYEKYANDHPDSPVTPEALYEAASRRAALIVIYQQNDEGKKSDEAKGRAQALAEKITARYPQTDWASRAYRLIFYVQQNIPTIGNMVQ